MAHPFRQKSIASSEEKFRQVADRTTGMEGPYKRAERISGTVPVTMPYPPEQAVPQFENDRSLRDPEYGSKVPPPAEDIS